MPCLGNALWNSIAIANGQLLPRSWHEKKTEIRPGQELS